MIIRRLLRSPLFPYTTLFRSKFSPTEIEGLAAMERGGMLVSKEVKNWRKYVELSAGRDEAMIESEIMAARSEEHTSELQSHSDLVCRLLLEKKKKKENRHKTP